MKVAYRQDYMITPAFDKLAKEVCTPFPLTRTRTHARTHACALACLLADISRTMC